MNIDIFSLFQSCKTLFFLKSIHAYLLIQGSLCSSDVVTNKLLRAYFRLGAIHDGCRLFDSIQQPNNSFLWTSIIHGHVQNHLYGEASQFFRLMRTERVPVLNFTLSSVIKALSRQSRLPEGECIRGLSLKSGFDSDLMVQNSLLDIYWRCGEVDTARLLFDEMSLKDVISWNCMISGYSNNRRLSEAVDLFDKMPDRNVVSWTAMICGYVKVGNMAKANDLFLRMPSPDSASYNVMISGYMDIGDVANAMSIFEQMSKKDTGTWNLMISGLCKSGDMKCAWDIFNRMPQKNVVSWSAIVDGYIRVGNLEYAWCLFEEMPEKNLISWSSMIAGYAKFGQPNRSLELFNMFKKTGIKPDSTFLSLIFSTYAQLGVLDTAEALLLEYVDLVQLSDVKLASALIDMYAKCGALEKAFQVFKSASKDLVCYSTMISALASHGMGYDAICLFNEMINENINPDGVVFLGVLTGCSHGGLVTEGRRLFKMMVDEFGLKPSERHYACMVDLLGRAGYLEEAHQLIEGMSVKPHSGVWGALLAACRVQGNTKLAEVAAQNLFVLEPDNSGNYILLCSIYAAAKRWDDVARVRGMIRENKVRKNRASSWIELDYAVHEFVMGDISHKDSDSIYALLDLLFQDIK
ncbi:putative pentatricopeptide repeat-containing protein At5g37570 [Aristolochia californica]|uniref:putative pentatricopeptide repeat-containing protein At5g37570 n=1 Tax=Aristolochia californica TaxID=171875 RepID=UPI0035D873E2